MRYQHPPFSTIKSSEARTSAALQAEQEAGWNPVKNHGETMTCMGSLIERFFPAKPEKKATSPLILDSVFSKKSIFLEHVFFFGDLNGFFFWDRPPINLGPPGTPYYSAQAQRMRLFRCPFAEVAFLWWLWISRHQIGVPPRVMYKTKRENFLQNNGSTFF